MQLAAHYNKASIIISVSVLLISGIIYYLTIKHIARQQLDSDLTEELVEVVEYVNTNHHLPKAVDFDEDVTTFKQTRLTQYSTRFFDAPYLNPKEHEKEEGRAVTALIKIRNENYIVTIVESRKNTEYLLQIIFAITLLLSVLLLVVLIITNRYILNGLWRPFYAILHQVKQFNIADGVKVTPVESRVDEFSELSDAVTKMSVKATAEYQGLKAFTENASHEMMTPLAVITSKLDMLIQDEGLQSDQYSQITDIYTAANKLSRLNQSLLLLVKIDNGLLSDKEPLNLKLVIIEKAQQFQELIKNKEIEINYQLDDCEIQASKYLIEVLLNNLFSNAIRHNRAGGSIIISLSAGRLLFQNTGEDVALDRHMIFERFYKGKTSDGTGLGLAIMKNICHQHGFNLTYLYANQLHTFQIDFK